ncbi:uncharacterized protein IL334_003656 [Kwoniella shivajii]|uniref:UBC core domain-containing protein n=1 Tax=Kwoniella shivajii TaxID=564305 RepID=A0ABZ1CZV8_9TREE|nr:hypothetical protein IL334_003656 [Kwoniella shivajii]
MSSRRKRDKSSATSSPFNIDQPAKRVTRSSVRIRQHQEQIQAEASSSLPSGTTSSSSSPIKREKPPPKPSKMSRQQPIVIDDSEEEEEESFFTGSDGEDIEVDDNMQAAISASIQDQIDNHTSAKQVNMNSLPSPAPTADVSSGREGWKNDVSVSKLTWGVEGPIEGYAGMLATIKREEDDSILFKLEYEDLDGREVKFTVNIVFHGITTYPASYKLLIFSSDDPPRRASTTFSRFTDVYDQDIPFLLRSLLSSLQGDDEATGGFPPAFDEIEYGEEDMIDPWAENGPGRGLETAKGSQVDLGAGWIQLKDHFEQAKKWGYRPGLTQVSDFWLRTAFGLDWKTADMVGMDEEESRQVFQHNKMPKMVGKAEKGDPVAKGCEQNLPLVAFHWILRRFMEAPQYCLNCGLEVQIPCLRPYVCDKPLCLYGFMSLGLGPSVEHTITTHPGVVDILLSFAYCAASSGTTNRMELPLHLHIEVPADFGIPAPQLLDELPAADQRRALAWLIGKLPRVSEIKATLDSGGKLKSIEAPPGAIGVLRWVIGSCRAYLKETKPGEGVQDIKPSKEYSVVTNFKQFTFVVGSPEQETNFKNEIEMAQKADKNCQQYPSLLAFHGSPAERWHNILRTGLDFTETLNGRAFGNGVYFASDSATSMGTYAREIHFVRPNADYTVSKATALVEIVNMPHTFVSQNPYYVVSITKQIKPFLLLVQGTEQKENPEDDQKGLGKSVECTGNLFIHDPTLKVSPKMNFGPLKVRMPEKLKRTKFKDNDPDDKTDRDILHPPANSSKAAKCNENGFNPSPQSRYEGLELLPPPSETSTVANKSLGKEFKALISAQEEGGLPFYINPDTDSLYCWLLELHTFPPDSHLYKELKQRKVQSIIVELRFPSSFPHSPPFMRILHPRMLPFMQGGGGNVTGGGSICNELMTATGWNPAFVTEAVVREVMTNLTEATPPARLDPREWNTPYNMREAVDAYKRVAKAHGWEVPKDFDRLAL